MNAPHMGIVHTTVKVVSTDKASTRQVELLVDTGSLFSWVPDELLRSLGWRPTEQWKVLPIDGREMQRSVCDALLVCEGRRGIVPVIFAQPGDFHVLGVTALERLG